MLRLPAVAGQFYPANPRELARLVQRLLEENKGTERAAVRACLVPHAGYVYSGHVAAAVFAQIELPAKIVILGVRHSPQGEALAILSSGQWRTPLGDAEIDGVLAKQLRAACPYLQEDEVAHRREHSLEVELPFLQIVRPGFVFVPIALGTHDYSELERVGESVAEVIERSSEPVLIVTSSDLNHYENDEITRRKDQRAIDAMERLDARGLYDVCRREEISMCGLGPAVAMLTAVRMLGAKTARVVRHATSGDINGERDRVVGYVGMVFN